MNRTTLIVIDPSGPDLVEVTTLTLNVPLNMDMFMDCGTSTLQLMETKNLEKSLKGVLYSSTYAKEILVEMYNIDTRWYSKWQLRKFENIFRDLSGDQKINAFASWLEEILCRADHVETRAAESIAKVIGPASLITDRQVVAVQWKFGEEDLGENEPRIRLNP